MRPAAQLPPPACARFTFTLQQPLRPPPLLFAACFRDRHVHVVVGLSASPVQCSSAGCDTCVRFSADSAASAKVSLRRPRALVESVRRVRPSSPLVWSSRRLLVNVMSRLVVSHCAPIWLRSLMFFSVCDSADLACGGQTSSAAAGWMRFALLSFAGTLALRGMAWTPRALRPEIPCDSPGLLTIIGGGSANLSSAFFNAWTFNCERKPNTASLFPASLLNASSWLPFSAGLLGMRQGRRWAFAH